MNKHAQKYKLIGYAAILIVGLGIGFFFGSNYMLKRMLATTHMGDMELLAPL